MFVCSTMANVLRLFHVNYLSPTRKSGLFLSSLCHTSISVSILQDLRCFGKFDTFFFFQVLFIELFVIPVLGVDICNSSIQKDIGANNVFWNSPTHTSYSIKTKVRFSSEDLAMFVFEQPRVGNML